MQIEAASDDATASGSAFTFHALDGAFTLLWPRPRDDRGGRSRAGSTGASRPRAGPESVETTSHAMGAQNSQAAAAAARDARESARA